MDKRKTLAVELLIDAIRTQLIAANVEEGSEPTPSQSTRIMGYVRGYTDIFARSLFADESGADILLFLKAHEGLTTGVTDPQALLRAANTLVRDPDFVVGAQVGAGDAALVLEGRQVSNGLSKLLST